MTTSTTDTTITHSFTPELEDSLQLFFNEARKHPLLTAAEEIAAHVELPIDEVIDIRRADRGPTSLDQGVGEDGDTSLGDLIAGDGPSIEDYVSSEMDTTALREAVDTLPDNERTVITLRF